jgi:hypothetical protein
MAVKEFVAVLSGDLVKSTGLERKRQDAMDGLLQAVKKARAHLATKKCLIFFSDFYSGDAFQCALSDPGFSLWTAIFLRTELTKLRANGLRVDVRLGLGLGAASEWNENHISASDGEAFRLSGKALDSLKSGKEKYRRLRILSPWPGQNELLSVLAAFLDALVQRWTPEQAEAIALLLGEKTQEEISKILDVKQPAVQRRLQTAGHFAVKEALDVYAQIINNRIIKSTFNNPGI